MAVQTTLGRISDAEKGARHKYYLAHIEKDACARIVWPELLCACARGRW